MLASYMMRPVIRRESKTSRASVRSPTPANLSVIDHRRDDAAEDPTADQRTHRVEDEHCLHPHQDGGQNPLFDHGPFHLHEEHGHAGGHDGRYHERNMCVGLENLDREED